jgi:DNA-binding NarL/FixJ family response regulator
VTPHPDLSDEVRAIEAVAAGLIDAELPAETLRRAVLAAWSGQLAFRRSALGAYLHAARRSPETFGECGLTARQRELLPYIAAGATDKEISASLGIAYTTVQKHLTNIRKRLGASNRAEVVFLTIQSPATAA